MCLKPSPLVCPRQRPLRRPTVQVHKLHRKRRISNRVVKERKAKMLLRKADMAIRNWRLYMENKSIIEQNERLRQRALLLHQENQALLSQLQNQNKLPNFANQNKSTHNHSNKQYVQE